MTRSVDDVIADVREGIARGMAGGDLALLLQALDAANAAIRDACPCGRGVWFKTHAPAIALARKGAP